MNKKYNIKIINLFEEKENNIQLSVALPCYNGKHIGWLCLESLCNQVNVNFDWEIVICEEVHENMLGFEFFKEYINRLKEVGCKKITYIEIDKWINLPEKWKLIGQNINKNSKVFLLQAIDCYSPSKRLSLSYNSIVKQKNDWVDFSHGYFYSFLYDKIILYNAKALTNLHMSFKSEYAKLINSIDKNSGIDGYLYNIIKSNIKKVKHEIIEELLEDSLDTDGLNNISMKRSNYYLNTKHPFQKVDKKIEELQLDIKIIEKIKNIHQDILNLEIKYNKNIIDFKAKSTKNQNKDWWIKRRTL